MNRDLSRNLLALFFVMAGILHFVLMPRYIGVMPPWLPCHCALVIISGVAEIAGGVGVLWPVTRRWAGYGLIALCLAVLPANVQMLFNAQAAQALLIWRAVLWLRLPLQGLLVAWIWQVARTRTS